jgi:hypothetical protein
MATYKNIRIPKRGGGTRTQRVQVLKSGKYRFVKNLKSGVRKVASRIRKKTKRRKPRKMARKRRRSRRSFLGSSTIFKFIRLGALIAPAIYRYQSAAASKGPGYGIRRVFESFAGIDWNGKFSPGILASMWLPFIMTNLVTHGIGKLNGIIRRI